MPQSWLSHLIAGGGKESGKMGRKAPGPEGGSGSPVSWLLLSSVHTDGPYSYVWPGWAEHHAATYSEIRDAAALTSLGKPLLCVFRNHTRDGLVHFMNVKIIYSIFVNIFILQIPIINKTIMILSESYITMKDIAFLPSCLNDCTQKQKTAWPELWYWQYNFIFIMNKCYSLNSAFPNFLSSIVQWMDAGYWLSLPLMTIYVITDICECFLISSSVAVNMMSIILI